MKQRLGEILLGRGLVTEAQLMSALELQQRRGWRLGNALIALGFLSEEKLIEVLGAELRLPVVDVTKIEPTAEALRAVRARLALEHSLLPLELSPEGAGPRILRVAMADPGDRRAIDELSFSAEAIIDPVLAKASDISRAVVRAYHLDPEAPLPSNVGELLYARDEVPKLSPTDESGDLAPEVPGGPLESELAASEDLNPIPLTQRKTLPPHGEDDLPAVIRGQPPSSLPPPRPPPFSSPPFAIPEDVYSVPRPLDPSRAAIAVGKSGDYEVGPGALEALYPRALLDGSGGVVRVAEIRTLERRLWAVLRLLVKKNIVDMTELQDALAEVEDGE